MQRGIQDFPFPSCGLTNEEFSSPPYSSLPTTEYVYLDKDVKLPSGDKVRVKNNG